MSQFLHDDNDDDNSKHNVNNNAKALTIHLPQFVSENSQAKHQGLFGKELTLNLLLMIMDLFLRRVLELDQPAQKCSQILLCILCCSIYR